MPPHTSKRQPLSCENCRKRKIKCTGQKNPCDTCVRRGFGHTCHYIRQGTALANPRSPEDIVQRLMRVESMLERHIEDTASHRATNQDSTNSACYDQLSPASSSHWTESNHQPTPCPPPNIRGTIFTSPRGYQRFVPGIASGDAAAVNELLQPGSSPMVASDFPFFVESSSSRQSLLDALPPTRQCEELKSVFFEVFSPLFHILHDPTFHAQYAEFRQNPAEAPLSFLALLFVILSIAVSALDEGHPLLEDLGRESSAAANIKSLAGRYRSTAMKCLSADQFLWQHTLHTTQTLVLLIYAISHAQGPSWALLGTTLNISIAIGLHVEPTHLNLPPVLSEERRRCWAGLMMLYTIQNTCLGNIAPQKIMATVNLPMDIDDQQLIERGSQSYAEGGMDSNAPTKMSYILYKFRLYQIAAEVCMSAQGNPDPNKLIILDRNITIEEEEHSARFSNHQDLPIYHLAHHLILKNYTNHLRLILHRPYLQQESGTSNRGAISGDTVLQSRRSCRRSAMKILDNHKQLYEIDIFRPYRWYIYGVGSFHTFLAASTLVVLLTTPPNDDPYLDYSTLLAAVQGCLVRFEKMAARSDICAKAAPILRRLLSPFTSLTTDSSSVQRAPPHQQYIDVAASDNSLASLSSLSETTSAYDKPLSSMSANSPPLPIYNGPSNFGPCPPELQTLVALPPEQWLGSPSSFSWADWDWNNSQSSSMGFQNDMSSQSHLFLRDGLINA